MGDASFTGFSFIYFHLKIVPGFHNETRLMGQSRKHTNF